jgi:hypothetical protein
MSARHSRIRDPTDQSLVDEAFWAKENEFLRHRLTLLEEYAKLNREHFLLDFGSRSVELIMA